MNPRVQAFFGLTGLLALLLGVLVLAIVRFRAAARQFRQPSDRDSSETAFIAAAMQEAVARVRDKEQAQRARADASERLSVDIVSGLTSGLLVITADGRTGIVNPAAKRLLRLTDAPASAAYADLLADVASPLVTVIDEALRTKQPIMRRVLDVHGAQLGVTVSPIVETSGRFQGIICLLNDLTSVVQLEERLRLRESLAQVGEMTAGIAHEFRNSLATIHGYARLISLDGLSERDRTCVEGIRQEATALAEVLTNFLHFARPTDVTMDAIELREILERAADEIRADVDACQGTLTITGPPAAVTIEGDEVLLRQAFGNLCRNALEACTGAGRRPVIGVELTIDPAHREAVVRVSDNGPGVDAAVRDRIFQPFFTTKGKGTGLGLALVQKIVITHNGRISPSHPPTGGLQMEVAFPLAETAPASAAAV